MGMQMKTVLLCLALVAATFAHYWVACTDYAEEGKGVNNPPNFLYDDAKCNGYPRYWKDYNGGFGEDRGFDYAGEGCGNRNVMSNPVSSAYTSEYPMAKWEVGKRVCLAWPSKNHVAADGGACPNGGATNAYIPDGGIRLFYSAKNPTNDPTQAEFKQKEILPFGRGIHASGTSDFNGFQNCPNFCANNDKSMCSGCFEVPDLEPGVYAFQWYWIFNPGSPYTTCFDAEIVPRSGNGGKNSAGALAASSLLIAGAVAALV